MPQDVEQGGDADEGPTYTVGEALDCVGEAVTEKSVKVWADQMQCRESQRTRVSFVHTILSSACCDQGRRRHVIMIT